MNANGLKQFFNGRRVLFFSAGAVLLVAIIVTAVLVARAQRAAGAGLYKVEKGTLRIVITEDGTLRAKESANVIADIEADAKIVWIIDEGTFVTKGAKLVELDKTQLQTYLDGIRLDLITLETNYLKAQQEQTRYLEAEGAQERKKLEFEVEKMRARLEKAEAQLPSEQHEQLYSASELRDARIAVDEARMNKETAELALKLFDEYTYPQKVRELEADLKKAKLVYEKEKAEEAKVSEQVKKMELYAPADGLVIYGTGSDMSWRGRRPQEEIQVGATVYKGQTIITLPKVTEMQVEIKVHEMDIQKVKRGQPATIYVHAFGNRRLTGTVGPIGALAHERDAWRSQGVKVFDVVVDIAGEHRQLRPGMTARVDILVGETNDVLLLPLEAKFTERGTGEDFCYVKTPTGPEKRAITLGESNNNFVIVTKGLEAGEEVYPYDPTAKAE